MIDLSIMSVASSSLWEITAGRPAIDPATLAAALQREVRQQNPEFRTRLLIRDGLSALLDFWGAQKFNQWLDRLPEREQLIAIWRSDLGPPGFPTLRERIMQTTQPQNVLEFLRELGTRIPKPTRIAVGGSIALILRHQLERATEDIDVVDEVPVEIRDNHELLDELAGRFGLRIAHFQSHYLPAGWESRLHSLGRFGDLDVDLVDTYDIFVGKLFSARTKDQDDLRMLARQLDKSQISRRLRDSAAALVSDSNLKSQATRNWYVLWGEPLPQ
jgi:hypothetical protein